MADVYPVVATLTFDGAVLVGKDQHLALIEVDGLPDRLRPRALGHEQELPARVVFLSATQDRQDLEGEAHLAIDILVQGIVVTFLIAQDQRRRPHLYRLVAAVQKLFESAGIRLLRAQLLRPIVSYLRERRVESLPKPLHCFGQRVVKVLVHPRAEP